MNYKKIEYDVGFSMDIIVENKVVIELKSAESLTDIYYEQLLTYLKLSDKKLGLLINFNETTLENSIKRVVNNL